MSMKTWRGSYYQVHAQDVAAIDAIQHALTKWIGLRPENLRAHGVIKDRYLACVRDDETSLDIDADSCALCVHYLSSDGCGTCPLAALRDGVSCSSRMADERMDPYATWGKTGDPEPMIALLEKALQRQLDRAKEIKEPT